MPQVTQTGREGIQPGVAREHRCGCQHTPPPTTASPATSAAPFPPRAPGTWPTSPPLQTSAQSLPAPKRPFGHLFPGPSGLGWRLCSKLCKLTVFVDGACRLWSLLPGSISPKFCNCQLTANLSEPGLICEMGLTGPTLEKAVGKHTRCLAQCGPQRALLPVSPARLLEGREQGALDTWRKAGEAANFRYTGDE